MATWLRGVIATCIIRYRFLRRHRPLVIQASLWLGKTWRGRISCNRLLMIRSGLGDFYSSVLQRSVDVQTDTCALSPFWPLDEQGETG